MKNNKQTAQKSNQKLFAGLPIDSWIKFIILPLFIFCGFIFRFWAIDFGYPNTKSRPDEDFIMRVVTGFLNEEILHQLILTLCSTISSLT